MAIITEHTEIVMFFDGACFPVNPGGTMGIGVAIYSVKNISIKEKGTRDIETSYDESQNICMYSRLISPEEHNGTTTNNVAEHMAFEYGVRYILENLNLDILKKVYIKIKFLSKNR